MVKSNNPIQSHTPTPVLDQKLDMRDHFITLADERHVSIATMTGYIPQMSILQARLVHRYNAYPALVEALTAIYDRARRGVSPVELQFIVDTARQALAQAEGK